MEIIFEPRFTKSLKKLSSENRKKVNDALKVFEANPFDPKLKNHKLKGRYQGLSSISAGHDLRLIFREKGGYVTVIIIDAGTHAQIY